MLTDEDKKFIEYWKNNRDRKKSVFRALAVGLPLSVILVVAIIANLYSGWYKRADMDIRSHATVGLSVMIAAAAIVIFITVFSALHRWDMNEQHYRELKAKEGHPN